MFRHKISQEEWDFFWGGVGGGGGSGGLVVNQMAGGARVLVTEATKCSPFVCSVYKCIYMTYEILYFGVIFAPET